MVEKSLNRGRNESIFPLKNRDGLPFESSGHWQNIPHVVPDVSDEIADKLNRHYGSRGGALDWGSPNVGLIVAHKTPAITEQAAYLGATAGRKLHVWELADLQNGHGPAETLIVPYINTYKTEEDVKKLGQESWGLPPAIVARLKNKVNFHEAVKSTEVEGFEVPEYKIATLRDVGHVARKVISESEELYAQHDLSGRYPMGVVIRAEESDGNYGNVIIHEINDEKKWGEKTAGKIIVITNGKLTTENINGKDVPKLYRKGDWSTPIRDANRSLQNSFEKGAKPRFVVSRYMNLADSPGMSLVLNKGYVESLGWNTQIQAEGTTACIGTEKYRPKTPYLARMQDMYEAQTAEDFASFILETAKHEKIPFEDIVGIINVDIMLPGPLEVELRRKKGQGDGYYVAECNARFTNYTDATMAALGLTGGEPTPKQIQRTVWHGVTSIDRMDLRGASPEAVRAELYEIDEVAKTGGDPNRAFMRMPDSPAGIILTGNRNLAQAKVDRAIESATGRRRHTISALLTKKS